MEIYQMPESRQMIEAYHKGHITLRELMEELEWYWDKKMHNATKATRGHKILC